MSAAPIYDPNPAIMRLVARVDDLAVLPHVVFKVLELSGSDESAASDMERAILVDPAFSAKLLTHANSSYYALARKITSVKEAIVYMGFKSVREMAMTIGVFDMFLGKNDKESLRRRTWWRHSIDTAVCCKQIALKTKRMSPDDAYTCGLLHLLGKTILDRFGEKDYESVEKRMQVGLSEKGAETAVYGCDHEQAGLAVAQKWGLPPAITTGLHYSSNPGGDLSCFAACVALGRAIAQQTFGGSGEDQLPTWSMQILEIDDDETKQIFEIGLNAMAEVGSMHI